MTRNQQRLLAALLLIFLFALQSYAVYSIYASHFLGGDDFYPRWAGGRALLLEGRDPYDSSVTEEIAAVLDPGNTGDNSYSFAYPLHLLFVIWPLSLLPYDWAYAIWMVCVQWLSMATVAVLLHRYRWRPSLVAVAGILLATIFYYPVTRSIFLGQFTVHITFFTALSLLALQKKHDGWAGVLLAVTSVKPQMVIIVTPWLVLWAARQRRWRVLSGFFGGGALMLVTTLALLPSWPLSFLEGLSYYSGLARGGGFPLRVLLEQGFRLEANWILYLLSMLLIAGMLFSWWQALRYHRSEIRQQINFENALHWSIIVNLLVPFQTGSTSQVLLLIPFVAWLTALLSQGRRLTAFLATLVLVVGPWILFNGRLGSENTPMLVYLPLLALFILIGRQIAEQPLAQLTGFDAATERHPSG